MGEPRPEKVAVVTEVRERLSSSNGALLTEYRGLKVADLANLRKAVGDAGGEYRIFKNTLVRLAAAELGLNDLEPLLVGPTAIAFVDGDAVAVAKSLRDFARTNPNLTIKGGLLGTKVLTAADAGGPRRRRPPRGHPGPAGRRPRRPAPEDGGPAPGPAPQLRLRAVRPRREADRRGSRRRRSSRPRPKPEAEAAAEAPPAEAPPAEAPPEAPQSEAPPARGTPAPKRPNPKRLRRRRRRPVDGHQGRDPRQHRRHDRARAVRAPEGVRGEVRRDRRRPRGRGRGRRRWRGRGRPPRSRSRTSSTSSSPRWAPRRFRSSRRCAPSPTSA